MPTFGETEYGAGEDNLEANRIYGTLYTCSEAGTVQSISARVAYQSSGGNNIKYAIYTNATPPVLIDYTGNGTLGASPATVTINGTQSGSVSAASFWLCAWSDTAFKWSAHTGSGADSNYWDQSYGSWPATLSTWADSSVYDFTISCTYTAGGSASVTPTPDHIALTGSQPAPTVSIATGLSVGAHVSPTIIMGW